MSFSSKSATYFREHARLEGYDYGTGCQLSQEQILNSVKLYGNSLHGMGELDFLSDIMKFDADKAAHKVLDREQQKASSLRR